MPEVSEQQVNPLPPIRTTVSAHYAAVVCGEAARVPILVAPVGREWEQSTRPLSSLSWWRAGRVGATKRYGARVPETSRGVRFREGAGTRAGSRERRSCRSVDSNFKQWSGIRNTFSISEEIYLVAFIHAIISECNLLIVSNQFIT